MFHTVQARKSRLLLCLESGVGVITEALWAPERLIPIGPAEQELPGGDVLDSRRENAGPGPEPAGVWSSSQDWHWLQADLRGGRSWGQ